MPYLLFLLGFILLPLPGLAQQPLVLHGSLPEADMDIAAYSSFYRDLSGDTLPLSVIRTKSFLPFSRKPKERSSFLDQSRTVTWVKFTIRNSHPTDTLRLYHQVYAHNDITTYENEQVIHRTGLALAGSVVLGSKKKRPIMFETELTIPPLAVQTYYVRVIDYIVTVTDIISRLSTKEYRWEQSYQTAANIQALMFVMCVLMGSLLFMNLYALYSYLLTRDKAFLYYFCYTFVAAFLSFHNIDSRFGLGWLYSRYTILNPYYPAFLHPGVLTIFYALFIAHILNIPVQFPRIWQMLRIALGVLFLQEAISVFEAFYGKPLFESIVIYKYGLLPGIITTILLIATVIRSRTPIRKYLLAGMVSLLFFTFASLLLNINPIRFIEMPLEVELIVNYIGVWIIMGLSVEGFCFALALAHRGRLIELENRNMHQQYAAELEAKLTERTQEIAEQSRQLEQQRMQQVEQAFEQRLAETEMAALRAQMNPHFIFNCLNSIKLYATDNDAAKAADYLTKFSRLIRLVLENSRSERITLQNELHALSLYLEMEAMRFKDKLTFSIDISPGIDSDFIEIPPLLIQPYVENAIWHGLMHKQEGGTVQLRVEQPGDNLLRVTISDDGVGRQKAAELKSKSATPRKSFGMEVTSERIALINQLYQTRTQVQIKDLVDASGEPAGTVVVLEIPI